MGRGDGEGFVSGVVFGGCDGTGASPTGARKIRIKPEDTANRLVADHQYRKAAS